MTRQLHPLLVEAFETGYVEHEGRRFALHSNIPVAECEMLYRQIEAVKASTALEIGMAYGVSSVALADALSSTSAAPALVSIDPHQRDEWGGVAVGQLERAGFAAFCELIEAPSHLALPALLDRGFRADLAFIDGWHTFDHCLIDFFYIDLILRPGGVVIFDDTWMPAVEAVVEFVLRNRAYVRVDAVLRPLSVRAKVGRVVGRRGRMLPPSAAVALSKLGDDDRPWHHFAPFAT